MPMGFDINLQINQWTLTQVSIGLFKISIMKI